MKLFRTLIALLTFAGPFAITPALAYHPFESSTPLESGKWVKIQVSQTGIHEISYDKLREMGFADPSKVSVFGMGGAMRDINFQSADGAYLYSDRFPQVAVSRANDKLYFYARGVENIEVTSTDGRVYFAHRPLNIYTNTAAYFLTDSQPVMDVKSESPTVASPQASVSHGYGYVAYEKDTYHNYSDMGQVYWSHDLFEYPELKFDIDCPYGKPSGINAFLSAGICLTRDMIGDITLMVNGTGVKKSMDIFSSFDNLPSGYGKITSDWFNYQAKLTEDSKAQIEFRANFTDMVNATQSEPVMALDYWVLTYPKWFSANDTDLRQEYLYVTNPTVSNGVQSVTVPEGSTVWDVTDPYNPVNLTFSGTNLLYDSPNRARELVVWYPEKEQYSVEAGYEPVEPQNLHSLRSEGADFAIVAVPSMLPYAQEIARLHREHDGINVAVATPDQIYNEFTAGVPDPMAYRAFFKMLYQHDSHQLKNALLMGPIYGDFRDDRGVDRPEGIIGYQNPGAIFYGEIANVMDWYGMLSDNIKDTNRLQIEPMHIGIGLLPINSAEEGALAVAKIREHLEKTDFSWVVNETMSVSCPGDVYLHDTQSSVHQSRMQKYASDYSKSKMIHSPVWVDKLGDEGARRVIDQHLDNGKAFWIYYGHSGRGGIAGIFTPNDLLALDNKHLTFSYYAGCSLASPDHGLPGFGDIGVTRAKRGFVGSVMASRTVLSNYNEEIAAQFTRHLFIGENGKKRSESPMAGDVYRCAKTSNDSSTDNSEPCYVYIGDPALRIPVSLGNIRLTLPDRAFRPGEVIMVKGEVVNSIGNTMKNYSGKVAIKLTEPTVTRLISGNAYFDYDDVRVAAVSGDVVEGEFEIPLLIPASCSNLLSSSTEERTNLQLFASAYSHYMRLGTSGYAQLPLTVENEEIEDEMIVDEQAPEISVAYDPLLSTFNVTVSDNVGFIPGIGNGAGTRLSIAGKTYAVEGDYSEAGVTEWTGTISLAHLPEGEYTYSVVASDMAGNSTSTMANRGRLTVTRPQLLQLEASSSAAIDNILLSLSGENADALSLMVRDSSSRTVIEQDVDDSEIDLDTSSLLPGVYTVAVRRTSPEGAAVCSNWVTFHKID